MFLIFVDCFIGMRFIILVGRVFYIILIQTTKTFKTKLKNVPFYFFIFKNEIVLNELPFFKWITLISTSSMTRFINWNSTNIALFSYSIDVWLNKQNCQLFFKFNRQHSKKTT